MGIIRYNIGPHEIEVDRDVVHVRFGSPYLPEDARQLMTLSDQIFREYGSMFWISDLSHGQMPGPETRRVVATWPCLGEYVSVAYGAGLMSRTMIQLIISANRLLGSASTMRVEVCATEPEARQLIAQLRRRSNPAQ